MSVSTVFEKISGILLSKNMVVSGLYITYVYICNFLLLQSYCSQVA